MSLDVKSAHEVTILNGQNYPQMNGLKSFTNQKGIVGWRGVPVCVCVCVCRGIEVVVPLFNQGNSRFTSSISFLK